MAYSNWGAFVFENNKSNIKDLTTTYADESYVWNGFEWEHIYRIRYMNY